ncbi:MAG: MMPL family transporter, partial [Candidatus Dormibacteraceae bacterium]
VGRAVGATSELDLVLKGPDVSSPAAVRWLAHADQVIAARRGGSVRTLTGLPAFLATFNQGQVPDRATTSRILAKVPAYFSRTVISGDHHLARTVYGVRGLTSVADDAALVRALRSLPPPPAGYHAFPAGMAVVAATALDAMSSQQLWLNLIALALVLAALLVAYRRPLPALLAVLPTAVAAGWATGLLFALGARTSPITVLLAGVVVAFATEFSVLWLSRYRSELRAGATAEAASEVASRRVGPAIVASALALTGGFLLLAVSPVPMVRDFGIWSGADLALATVAVLTLLPPTARRLLTRG